MEIPAGITKLAAGGVAVIFATATAAGQLPLPAEIPLPEGHTVVDVLFMALATYALNQIRLLNKKVEDKPVDSSKSETPSGKPKGVNDYLLKQLEKIAFGVDKTSGELVAHRLDFAEFRGNVEARLDNLENR